MNMDTMMQQSILPKIETVFDEDFFKSLRSTEFSRLDKNNQIYFDYTGGNLYPESLILKHQEQLLNGVFGNPHSTNPTSQQATILVEEARQKVLDFFNAKDYFCVFTANASASLKIVGESYPFCEKSNFLILSDNHNSVNGIREYCKGKKANTQYIPVMPDDLQIDGYALSQAFESVATCDSNLFAFPAQSNVTGVKHDLNWIKKAQEKGIDVLLDAAAFVPTSSLDLSIIQPEFVSASFYKIFGYPTGLGCLLIKKSVFNKLQKPWFAGGTVTYVSVIDEQHQLMNNHERFEDGTINYVGIPAIKLGLEFIESIGLERINKRVLALIETLYKNLLLLRHDNGKPLLKIFGPSHFENHGGNIIMSFFDQDGKMIPSSVFEMTANANNISIRTGCFCNPGVNETNNLLTKDEVSKYFLNQTSEEYDEYVNLLKELRGATRVSVGMATTTEDLQKLVDLMATFLNKSYHFNT